MQGGVFLKNKVEQLRKERGLNQDDFAKRIEEIFIYERGAENEKK